MPKHKTADSTEIVEGESTMTISTAAASKIKLTRTGLTFIEPPSFDEWAEIGQHLFIAEQSIQWAIGDWLIYGEDNLARVEKGRYQQMMDALGENGYAYNTIKQFAFVSRTFPACDRSHKLSWTQYLVLTKAGEENRDKWHTIVRDEEERGNHIPKRLLARSIECGELLKPEDFKVPPEEKAIDNHCNWIVGLRNWWKKFKDSSWWDTAQDYQIDAMLQDFEFVEDVYETLKARKEKLNK